MKKLLLSFNLFASLPGSLAIGGDVVHDGSLGPRKTLLGPNFVIDAADGRQLGSNLFHSFEKLDLATGEIADFTGPASVRNLLARVTDGNTSVINGTLRCAIPGANFFFVNPGGVIFGPDVALDVDGAFVVTSADVIKLADGGRFAANTSTTDSVLTSAAPSAFGFLGSQPAPLILFGDASTNTPSRLRTKPARTLSLVGGNIIAVTGAVEAPSGRVNLLSVGGPGEIAGNVVDAAAPPTNVDAVPLLGDIDLSASSAATVSGDPAGSIVIRAQNFAARSGSSITSSTTDADVLASPAIDLAIRNRFELVDGSSIVTSSFGAGATGAIKVVTRTGILSSNDASGFTITGINSLAFAGGSGGDLDLHFRTLDVQGFANISIGNTGTGDAGQLVIHVGRMSLSGESASVRTSAIDPATGSAGDLTIRADSLSIDSGGSIFSRGATFSPAGRLHIIVRDLLDLSGAGSSISSDGQVDPDGTGSFRITAGKITLRDSARLDASSLLQVNAGAIVIDVDEIEMSGDSTIQASTLGNGAGGTISIRAGSLSMREESDVFTSAFGDGAGGFISIIADDITLDSRATIGSSAGSGIPGFLSNGPGGDVTIRARTLTLLDGGAISAATVGNGNGGKINIIVEGDAVFSGDGSGIITPSAAFPGATLGGNGGSVQLRAASLLIENGAAIVATTVTTGRGGNISINVGDLRMIGTGALSDADTTSSILSRSRGEFDNAGDGGNIDIAADTFSLTEGALISSASLGRANGGNISLQVAGSARLQDSTISAETGNQGNISIASRGDLTLFRSTITAQARETGGVITVNGRVVALGSSTINGLAGGQDVLVTIDARALLSSIDSRILTDRGVFTIDTNLAQSLAALDAALTDPASKLQADCVERNTGDFSSFTTVGFGGVALDPAHAGGTPNSP